MHVWYSSSGLHSVHTIFFFFRSATGFTLREEGVREMSARQSRRIEMCLPAFRHDKPAASACIYQNPFLEYCKLLYETIA